MRLTIADLVAVLKISSHAGKIDEDLDAVLCQLVLRADAGEHEKLGRVEGAAGKDHLAGRPGRPLLARLLARVAMGAVQALALEILDADRSFLIIE